MKKTVNKAISQLRQKAEEILKRKNCVTAKDSDPQLRMLLHELDVYRIELEMQNEELRNAYNNAEELSQKYIKLYDFAPSGYLSLNKEGKILDLNLTSCHMLGKDRSDLKNMKLEQFVSSLSKSPFNQFLHNIFETKVKEICEINFEINTQSTTYYLTGCVDEDVRQCEITMVDISKLKQAEKIVENLEKRKRSFMLQSILDGYLLIDKNGYLLETNDSYCRLSGYTFDEVIGMHISNLYPEILELDFNYFLDIVAKKVNNRFDWQLSTKTGDLFDVEINAQYLDENGGRIIIFLHDITERKQIESHLRQFEERYKSLFQTNNSVLLILNPETSEIMDANQAACNYYGWSHDEMCLKKYADINNENPNETIENLLKAKKQKSNHLFETHILANGEHRDVEVYSGLFLINDENWIYEIIHDITDSNRNLKALKESECLLRESQLAANIGSYSYDFSDNSWKGTDEFFKIFGIDKTYSFTLESWGKLIHPDSLDVVSEFINEGKVTNKYLNCEYKIIRFNDKETRWILALGTFEFDINNKPVRLIGTIQDITNLKLAEEALGKLNEELEDRVNQRTTELLKSNENLILAEKKYRTVADFTFGWEFWLDENENFIYCSPACERITGYKAEEFINNPDLIINIIHPDDYVKYKKHSNREKISEDSNYEMQYRIIRSDGNVRWIGHYCQSLYSDDGKFMGIRGSNQDITDRIAMDQIIKTSNQKYKLLSENIKDGIFIWKNGHFEYVNLGMCQIFEMTESELIESTFIPLFLPEYQDELSRFLDSKFSENKNIIIESEFKKNDQSIGLVEILLSYVVSEDSVYGVVHDITEKKQHHINIVNTIIQTEEKERLNFSKELHDGLGPLLSTLKLYMQWAERPMSSTARDEIIKKADEILEESIITVKEISYKLSPHILINHGLNTAVKNFIDRLKNSVDVKINFESDITERLDSKIEISLYRAIIECLNNTIKYADACNIYIDINLSDNVLRINYRDDGKGFDINYMTLNQTSLGIFNLQNRIKTLGGKVNMKSEPGKGVDYEFVINLNEKSEYAEN